MTDKIYPFDAVPEGGRNKICVRTGRVIRILQHANCNYRHTQVYDWEIHDYVQGGSLEDYKLARDMTREEHTEWFRDGYKKRSLLVQMLWKIYDGFYDFKDKRMQAKLDREFKKRQEKR